MIPSERSHIHVAATTHPGMSGKNNEDNYAVSAHRLSQSDRTSSVLAVLADGVGGHQAGEVASEIATETISKIVLASDANKPLEILEYAMVQANQKVANHSVSDNERLGMGSTCSCVWIIGDRAYTTSLGDSRIYFIRNGQIRQVTTDHTWVQEAIEHGIIKPEQARNHPRAHVIRRYLGSKKPIEPDFRLRLHTEETDEKAISNQGMKLLPGDQFLICSDGLTDLVEDIEILESLQDQNKDSAIQSLVDLANSRGGHDNITIIHLQVPLQNEEVKLKRKSKRPGKVKLSWQIYLAISIVILVVAALSTILYLYVSRTPIRLTSTPSTMTTETIQSTSSLQQELQPTNTFSVTLSTPPSITPSMTPSISLTETPIQDTYTPWPTNTTTPEP
jgi:protein phosphatase